MEDQGRELATLMAGLSEQLGRIEAKLDALLEALDQEGEEEDQVVEVNTMDGRTFHVPKGDGFL